MIFPWHFNRTSEHVQKWFFKGLFKRLFQSVIWTPKHQYISHYIILQHSTEINNWLWAARQLRSTIDWDQQSTEINKQIIDWDCHLSKSNVRLRSEYIATDKTFHLVWLELVLQTFFKVFPKYIPGWFKPEISWGK